MSKEIVFRFPRNENEEVQFSIGEYKDKLYFDIRLFFKGREDEWRPTKKGLTFSTGHFGEFEKGIEALSKTLLTREENQ